MTGPTRTTSGTSTRKLSEEPKGCWICSGQHDSRSCPERCNLRFLINLRENLEANPDHEVSDSTRRSRLRRLEDVISRLQEAEQANDDQDRTAGSRTPSMASSVNKEALDGISATLHTMMERLDKLQEAEDRRNAERESRSSALDANKRFLQNVEQRTLSEALHQAGGAGAHRTTASSLLNLNRDQRREVEDIVRDPLLFNPLHRERGTVVRDQAGQNLFARSRYLKIVDHVDRTYAENTRLALQFSDGV